MILPHTVSDSLSTRFQATRVLNAFVLAKLSALSGSWDCHQVISRDVRLFIDVQASKRKSPQSQACLTGVLTTALALDKAKQPGEGPSWATVVLAALVVLSDSHLFTHPPSLKLFFNIVAQTLKKKRSTARALHSYVWKCLVWAFSRLKANPEGDNVKERAFRVVKQELGEGIGIALVASVIAEDRERLHDYVPKALEVIKDMIRDKQPSTREVGVSLLVRLAGSTSSAKSSHEWDSSGVLARQLFDGTFMDGWENLTAAVRLIDPPKFNLVRSLSDAEIFSYSDAFMDVWVEAVEVSFQEPLSELPVSCWSRTRPQRRLTLLRLVLFMSGIRCYSFRPS